MAWANPPPPLIPKKNMLKVTSWHLNKMLKSHVYFLSFGVGKSVFDKNEYKEIQ